MADLTKSIEKIAALLSTYQQKPGSYRVQINVVLTNGEPQLDYAVSIVPPSRRSGVAARKFK